MSDPRAEDRGEPQSFVVPPELAGERLDAVLARLAPEISRSRWKAWIQAGNVAIGGSAVPRPNRILNEGEVLVTTPPPAPVSVDPEGRTIRELVVLHEDEAILVVDKPAGLVVHPNDRHGSGGTLADLLRLRHPDLATINGDHRPGIVHRLDRLTSGVMVIGRTLEALQHLKSQFQERTVEKRYLALVHGEPRFASDWIEARIAPDPRNPRRMRVLAEESEEEGREASTYYEVQERFGMASLLECRPKTGRTHQIRVHLQSIGLPIVGDRIYKQAGALPHPMPEEAPRMSRQSLHARAITVEHPTLGERMTFEAAPPKDFEELARFLRVYRDEPSAHGQDREG